MELKIEEVKLFRPYVLGFMQKSQSFIMFMDRHKKTPLILEHNHNVKSILIHRWIHYKTPYEKEERDYLVTEFNDFRYVIKSLFEAVTFRVEA